MKLSSVLLVDDDPNFLAQFKAYLESKEISVFCALNALEALKILSEKNIAVILADERMPGQKGAELLEEVQKKYPDVVRVLITGYSDLQSVINAVNRGAIYRYVYKKLNPEEILIVVKQSLEKFRNDQDILRFSQANRRLLRMLSAEQNLSVVGIFGKEVSQKIEEIVTGISAYLFRKAGDNQERVPSQQRLKNDFGYLDRALKRIRDLSSPAPEGEKTASIVDFHRLLKEEIESLKKKAFKKDIFLTIDLNLEKGSSLLPISLFSLRRMMKELLENAVLFSPPSRCLLEIRTSLKEDHEDPRYEISIVNPTTKKLGTLSLGTQSLPQNLQSCFAPFYTSLGHVPQLDEIPMPDGAGYNLSRYFHYGLGLPLAQWVAASHGGVIELHEEGQKVRVVVLFSL